jgi:hypothetical protein
LSDSLVSQAAGGVLSDPQSAILLAEHFELHQGPAFIRGSPNKAPIQWAELLVPNLQTQWSLGAVNRPIGTWSCGSERTPPCGPHGM